MKIKKEYVILFTLILALALYLMLRNPDRTHYQLPDVPDISQTDISKIEISKPESTIVLDEKDDTWHIAPEGYRANMDRVKNMLEILKGLSVTALVSERAAQPREAGVVRDDHASLTRGELLVGVESEDSGIAHGARRTIAVATSQRLT